MHCGCDRARCQEANDLGVKNLWAGGRFVDTTRSDGLDCLCAAFQTGRERWANVDRCKKGGSDGYRRPPESAKGQQGSAVQKGASLGAAWRTIQVESTEKTTAAAKEPKKRWSLEKRSHIVGAWSILRDVSLAASSRRSLFSEDLVEGGQ